MSEHHTFSVADAVEFGVNKAILLHNFRFWLGVNQRNNECQREGATWTFMTAEQIAGAHAYFSESSVARWLKELAEQNKIIRRMFGRGYNRMYWYTMPEYMSKNSPHYPHETQDKAGEPQNSLISHNEKLKTHNEKLKTHNEKSLRYLNKDTNNNTNTNNTSDEIFDNLESCTSFAQNLKNQIDEIMEQSTADTIDDFKKRAVDLLPEFWIKKNFAWKGVRDEIEIFDVVDAFLLNIIAHESDARERNMYYVNLSYDKITAKLNNWVTRYANQRATDRARDVKFAKEPILSPAEQHRLNNREAFVEEAGDECAYMENLYRANNREAFVEEAGDECAYIENL